MINSPDLKEICPAEIFGIFDNEFIVKNKIPIYFLRENYEWQPFPPHPNTFIGLEKDSMLMAKEGIRPQISKAIVVTLDVYQSISQQSQHDQNHQNPQPRRNLPISN